MGISLYIGDRYANDVANNHGWRSFTNWVIESDKRVPVPMLVDFVEEGYTEWPLTVAAELRELMTQIPLPNRALQDVAESVARTATIAATERLVVSDGTSDIEEDSEEE